MDALNVELDAGDPFVGAAPFEQLQPFVVDVPRFEIGGGQSRSAAKVVVAGESRFRQDLMHGPASAAAIGCKRVVDERLRAVLTP